MTLGEACNGVGSDIAKSWTAFRMSVWWVRYAQQLAFGEGENYKDIHALDCLHMTRQSLLAVLRGIHGELVPTAEDSAGLGEL